MPTKPRVYWDACTFLGLLNGEAHKASAVRSVWDAAEAGKLIICTSFFTFAEVFRAKCEGVIKPLVSKQDQLVENLLQQKFIEPAVVDERIGTAARRLMRQWPQCKKPADGIHLATACRLNVDEMHTFDATDMLALDNVLQKRNGNLLHICHPHYEAPPPPPAPEPDPPPFNRDLFEGPYRES